MNSPADKQSSPRESSADIGRWAPPFPGPDGTPRAGAASRRTLRWGAWVVSLAAALGLARLRGNAAPTEAPGRFEWRRISAEGAGFDAAKLQAAWRELETRGTTAFLVIRRDAIVFERYAEGFHRARPHYTASLAKALVGATSLLLAMDDGRIAPEDLVSRFVPQWAEVESKRRITIRHLATHTSGLEDAEADGLPHDRLPGWKGEFWKRLAPPRDPFTLARDVAPVLESPGTRARYSNPGMAMLAYCVTASLPPGPNRDIRALLRERVMRPLGVPDAEWSVGYGQTFPVAGLPLVPTWGGGSFSPDAVARLGRLMRRGGDWQGRRLLSAEAVRAATTHAGLPNNSGLGWWVNRELNGARHWPTAPSDAFWGAGAGHQCLLVVPSLDLIVVRQGEALDTRVSFDDALERHLVAPVLAALLRLPEEAVVAPLAPWPEPAPLTARAAPATQ